MVIWEGVMEQRLVLFVQMMIEDLELVQMKVNKKKVLIVGFGILFLLVVFFGVYLVIVYVMLVLIRDVSYIIVYFEGGLLRYYVFFFE